MRIKMKLFFVFALMLSNVLIAIGCGSAPRPYQYSWEVYKVDKSAYMEERQKIVDSLENALVRHKFYPEERKNLEKPGEGMLMTDWNDEAARNTISSYDGYRLRVHAIITDDLSEFQEEEDDDPILKRYIETTEDEENKMVEIGLAIAVEKEINTAMPKYLGDVETARWQREEEDLDYAKRLHYEILKSFNLIAKDPLNTEDYLSDKMKKILGGSPDRPADKDDSEKNKPKDDFRVLE